MFIRVCVINTNFFSPLYLQQAYLFDKSLISDYDKDDPIKSPIEPEIADIPYLSETVESVAHGIEIFDTRSRWAEVLLDKAEGFKNGISAIDSQIDVIIAGVKVALLNLNHPLPTLEKNIKNRKTFFKEVVQNTQKTSDWENYYAKLQKINLVGFLKPANSDGTTTLSSWVDKDGVSSASLKCNELLASAQGEIKYIEEGIISILSGTNNLEKTISQWAKDAATAHDKSYIDTFQDVKALATRIKKDAEHVSSLEETTINLANVTKLSTLHEREFLNELKTYIFDLHQKLTSRVKLKKTYQDGYIDHLREISQLQYQTSTLRPQLQTVQQTLHSAEDQRVKVAQVVELPYLYGMLLLEHYRRKLWSDYGGDHNSSKEIKFRENWKEHCGNVIIDLLKANNMSEKLPTKLITDGSDAISKEDIGQYFQDLNEFGFNDLLSELKLEYEGLIKRVTSSNSTRPTSQQKLFKSGTISENNSVLLDSDNRKQPSSTSATPSVPSPSPQTTTATSDDAQSKIRDYETRIRKLESLLHRRQYSEMGNNNDMAATGSAPMTPPGGGNNVGGFSLQNSNNSNKPQPNRLLEQIHTLTEDRKKDQEQISNLKAQNSTLEEKIQILQQEKDNAENIKTDLLANMSAQESEFSRERRGLNQEISELNMRIDELEEDAEREGEKMSELESKQDQEIQRLEKQLESVKLREHENNQNYSQELEKFIAKEHELENENDRLKNKLDRFICRSRDLSQRLYTSYKRSTEVLECIGLQASKEIDDVSNQVVSFKINRVRGLRRSSGGGNKSQLKSTDQSTMMIDSEQGDGMMMTTLGDITTESREDDIQEGEPSSYHTAGPTVLYWMDEDKTEEKEGEEEEDTIINREEEQYTKFTNEVYIDYDIFRDSVYERFKAVERLARKGQQYRDRAHRAEKESKQKISIRSFKQGDLALFLPTRDQSRNPQPWATFNVGAPHYFLKPSKDHQIDSREWLVARITNIDDRVVNRAQDGEEDNPFDLSDGLKWHWVEAIEER